MAGREVESPADGFELLEALRHEHVTRERRWLRLDEAACRKWARHTLLELWQAVALHSHLDPDSCGASGLDVPMPLCGTSLGDALTSMLGGTLTATPQRLIASNYAKAKRAVCSGELSALDVSPQRTILVTVDDFVSWARKVSLPVAGQWNERGGNSVLNESLPFDAPLLKVAQAAYRHFERDYEAARKGGKPITHEIVARWIKGTYGGSLSEGMQVARFLDPRGTEKRAGRPRKERPC